MPANSFKLPNFLADGDWRESVQDGEFGRRRTMPGSPEFSGSPGICCRWILNGAVAYRPAVVGAEAIIRWNDRYGRPRPAINGLPQLLRKG